MKNPYKILEVIKSASQDEIKKSYRNLVKKHHPDLNPGNKKAEERFKEISYAYDLIGTPEERKKFDDGEIGEQQNQDWQNQWQQAHKRNSEKPRNGRYSQTFADQFGTDDFFEELFRSHRSGPEQGPPKEASYQMTVSFQESIRGAEKVITLRNGKSFKIKIPPGINPGNKLRFKNLNDQTTNEKNVGDVLIEIKVEPLEGWTRHGIDLITEVSISFIEGILGAEISVFTMYGSVMLKIPPGVNTGTKLRIKGKGIKKENEIGNQIVQLKVMLPKAVPPELKAVISSWQGKFDYNPRNPLKEQHHNQTKNHNETRGEV